ncbi:MAG: hypothetical protein U0U66_00840 [Cytophagaceae bacterium]
MRILKLKSILSGISFLLISLPLFSQSFSQDSSATQKQKQIHSYPEIKGYVGLVSPIYMFSNDGNTLNGKHNFVIGNPWGINIWKSKRFGFSFEFTPFLKIDKNNSKMSNFVFHPGILYRLGHEFTFIGRVAYETSGRYGFTPIINKVIKRTPTNTFFIAVLLPARFGNGQAVSIATALQIGIGF